MDEDLVVGHAADAPGPRVGTYVLCLRLGRGESLIGTITPVGAIRGIEFHGWIDFMSAVNLLRAEPQGPRPDGAD
ncbi:MAG: hypothetical protein ACRDOO_13405 [Actinomadura sp.]